MTYPRLRYQTIEFSETDIHICTLRDKQQFYDPKGIAAGYGIPEAFWSLFGVVWPSSLALAHFIDTYDTSSRRILEIGCGIALPSLLLNHRQADITATDYHPEAGPFLIRNAELNKDRAIRFERTGWADQNDKLGLFDLIIGSDLLYEDEHIDLLAQFIDNHSLPSCEILLADPGRGRKTKLALKLEETGFAIAYLEIPKSASGEDEYKGHIIKFTRSEPFTI
mgnify:CR=1 FL=1|jgi:predicted nicotinamide N-methyase